MGILYQNSKDSQNSANSKYQTEIDFGNQTWDELEENYIRFLLKKNNWNVTWAAKASGLNRSTFASRMRRLGIRKSDICSDLNRK
ncbi:MAG: hypothetical protein HQK69_07335 [Desulfamplus sp.]|nr:hypothetical protein [Desulfamplus sp.]